MRKILGMDIGTNSIGWAVIGEYENKREILSRGCYIYPLELTEMQELKNTPKKYFDANSLAANTCSILYGILFSCIIGLALNIHNWQFWLNLIIPIFLAILNLSNKR